MPDLWTVLQAEIVKQHHYSFHSAWVYFSLLVWPVLGFFTVYYSYKPFSLSEAGVLGIHDSSDLMLFLCTGYMAYTCFFAMVQSAWQAGWSERQNGTLEMAFLSPANRLMLVYGRALGALLEETWMFLSFCVLMLFWAQGWSWGLLLQLPLVFVILLVSATVWGGLMNTVFLFSRDASLLLNLFDDPMVLFSGVRVPVESFPLWARLVSLVFPLTYCLHIMRALFLPDGRAIWPNLLALLLCLFLMVGLTLLLLRKAEKIQRERGELVFY